MGIPALIFAASYSLALLTESFFPALRLDALPNVFGGPLARLRQTFAEFDWRSIFALPGAVPLTSSAVGQR